MSSMIRPFTLSDQAAVIALWDACGLTRPWNDPLKDIARKLQVRPDWFLVGEAAGTIVASVMVGYDGHRGWLNYLSVSPTVQRQGWGRKLVEHAERLLAAEGCPKLNLQVRGTNTSALEFYHRLGYGVDDVVSLGKRLIADLPSNERSPPPTPV
jgi:ribosomal protein S18 acetylase RimI-like enzyme